MKKVLLMAMLLIAPLSLFAQSATKFGHFNSAEIIQAMPEYTAAQTEVNKLKAQYDADLKTMQDELQKKADEYDKAKDSLPQNVQQRREQELQDLYKRIQQSYQDNQEALQKTSSEKMQAIQAKVQKAVQEIGAAGGFVYIMDATAGIPYISTTLSTDITAQLKAKLGLKK